MSRIDGPLGAIAEGWQKATDNLAATVQVGESKLADVARRIGVDADRLREANPHLPDTTDLKVGQEICLPHPGQQETPGPEHASGTEGAPASGLPRAPIGDPLNKLAFQLGAESKMTPLGQSTETKVDVSEGSNSATIGVGEVNSQQGMATFAMPYAEAHGKDSKGDKLDLGVNMFFKDDK